METIAQRKNSFVRDLSFCVIKRFNGYNILKAEIKDEEKKFHQPINIVYVLIKKSNEIMNCYFTNNVQLTYRSYCTVSNKGNEILKNQLRDSAIIVTNVLQIFQDLMRT